jgi:hypothetical protein
LYQKDITRRPIDKISEEPTDFLAISLLKIIFPTTSHLGEIEWDRQRGHILGLHSAE